jgi:hypothetical protein
LHIDPALVPPSGRGSSPAGGAWVVGLDGFVDPSLREALDAAGAVRIGYRELRDLMRQEAATSSPA